MTPRLLDLFCGAGGAAKGYADAGFEVIGVDIEAQPNYPYEFHQGDARSFPLDGFDAVHASPPCQAHSGIPNRRSDHPDYLDEIRLRLIDSDLPYVLENVPGAPMPDAFVLCGATFGLPIIRHRLFETFPRVELVPSSCPQTSWGRARSHGPGFYPYAHGAWRPAWRTHVLPAVWPWMTLEEAEQAIPPAYTEYIGRQLMTHLREAVA